MGFGEEQQHTQRIQALLSNVRIDAATGEVVAALRDRGVDSLVLKGATLTDWYPAGDRIYDDGDLWVAPADYAAAEGLLAELGFVAAIDESSMPDWWQEHASGWTRERDGGKIDLHRRLQGAEAEPSLVWSTLWAERDQITIGGVAAWRLSPAGAALYVTMHATHHGEHDGRGIPHLVAALAAVDDQVWNDALLLARRIGALDSFATGLRLLPAGTELAHRIGAPATRSTKTTLLASTPPPVALGFDQLAAAGGLRRLEILLRKLVPPPGFIRHWWPPAARNEAMLVVGYLYRPVWLLRHAPAGYRAWRAARRKSNSSS